jgi:hypothetical protein
MISFVTPKCWAQLGISASMEFVCVMDPAPNEDFSMDRIQEITPEFMAKIEQMKTSRMGFTPDYKSQLIEMFRDEQGQKCAVVGMWLFGEEDPRIEKVREELKSHNT